MEPKDLEEEMNTLHDSFSTPPLLSPSSQDSPEMVIQQEEGPIDWPLSWSILLSQSKEWLSWCSQPSDSFSLSVSDLFPQQSSPPTGVGAGLSNLGTTCFMNAILQCFTHTVPLVQSLRSSTHPEPCDGGVDGFCAICSIRGQIESSLAASGRILSPRKLVDNLNNFSSNFTSYQQEDAHEFMLCALNKLRRCFQDLNEKSKSCEGDINLVERVFGGRLISKLRCCNCGCCSDTYDPLIDLSLEIENVDTLPRALESFTKVENIDAKFQCDSCNEEVSMERQLLLDQTPLVAAFHLKRFKTVGTFVQKIDNHVCFPLQLDLQPYTFGNHNDNVFLKYDLYAVVVHDGNSSTSGHYFCFVRSAPDTWHRLDDSKVTRVLEDSVLSQNAYILFYARQGTPWFSSIMECPTPCVDPKPVSDNVDTTNKSNPSIAANVVRDEARESKELAGQKTGNCFGERNERPEIDDTLDACYDSGESSPGSSVESAFCE